MQFSLFVYLIYIESTAVSFPAFPLLSHDIFFSQFHTQAKLLYIMLLLLY